MISRISAQNAHLVQHRHHDGLAAKAGLYGHNRDLRESVQIGQNGLHGCAGRNSHANAHFVGLNGTDDGLGVVGAFYVEGDHVRARLDKSVYVADGIVDHEMYVKDQLGGLADGRNQLGTKADVGNKRAVHNVQMQISSSRILNLFDFICQMRVIGGQQGRGDISHNFCSFLLQNADLCHTL